MPRGYRSAQKCGSDAWDVAAQQVQGSFFASESMVEEAIAAAAIALDHVAVWPWYIGGQTESPDTVSRFGRYEIPADRIDVNNGFQTQHRQNGDGGRRLRSLL